MVVGLPLLGQPRQHLKQRPSYARVRLAPLQGGIQCVCICIAPVQCQRDLDDDLRVILAQQPSDLPFLQVQQPHERRPSCPLARRCHRVQAVVARVLDFELDS